MLHSPFLINACLDNGLRARGDVSDTSIRPKQELIVRFILVSLHKRFIKLLLFVTLKGMEPLLECMYSAEAMPTPNSNATMMAMIIMAILSPLWYLRFLRRRMRVLSVLRALTESGVVKRSCLAPNLRKYPALQDDQNDRHYAVS